jgi:thiamine biosynthesis lipoprotein
VLNRAQALAMRTDGAFDVTAGPYVNLWRRARRLHELPKAEKLAEARRAVGYKNVRLDQRARAVELLAPNMRLDLGGIAKGYAVDQALAVLRTRGIKSALVAGSGDLAVSEAPPGKKGWRIEIAAHDATNAPARQFVWLRHQALATSGDVFQNVEITGQRYSHIVDPRTGVGLTDRSLVTIIAPDCTTADGFATAVSVLGPVPGLQLVESTRGVAALITRKPGATVEQIASRRFRGFVTD